jgi:hypothetical protein
MRITITIHTTPKGEKSYLYDHSGDLPKDNAYVTGLLALQLSEDWTLEKELAFYMGYGITVGLCYR